MKRIASIILMNIFLFGLSTNALFADRLAEHMYISGLEESQAPVYHLESDSIIFSYKNELPRFQPRQVGVAFEHEKFAKIHQMRYYDTRNEDDELQSRIYFLFLPLDTELVALGELHYRYIIDGIWMEDPKNPEYQNKISGARMSVAHIPVEREEQEVSPEVINGSSGRSRIVRFRYEAEPNQDVFLAGSFNNWDPFMYKLQENPLIPGEYRIEIRLLPGNYHYNYYYRGRKIKDPLNERSSYDIEGYEYSVFSVES